MKHLIFLFMFAMASSLLMAQDLGTPFGWAACNGGTTGSGYTNPYDVPASGNYIYRPTTETELLSIMSTLQKLKGASPATIVIPQDTKIIFEEGLTIKGEAANISILGEPGAEFIIADKVNGSTNENGCLNIKGSNIIVRNIIFTGPGAIDLDASDPLGIEGGKNVWVDHCSFSDGRDGNLDIKSQANYVTISWCKFFYTDKSTGHKYSNLLGHSDSNTADTSALKVTYALNWWGDGVTERTPRVRFGSVHCVNNLYRMPGNNYCIRAGKWANIYADNNAFVNVKNPIANDDDNNSCFVTMNVDSNLYVNCSGTMMSAANLLNNSGAKFNPYNEYSYRPIPKSVVEAVVTNTNVPEGYAKTTGAGATLWAGEGTSVGVKNVTVNGNNASLNALGGYDYGFVYEATDVQAIVVVEPTDSKATVTFNPSATAEMPTLENAVTLSFTITNGDNSRTYDVTLTRLESTVVNAGASIFGSTVSVDDYFWFNTSNESVVNSLVADGTISGTVSLSLEKNDASYTDKVGAMILPKGGGTMIFKLPSCGYFALYMVRTGSYAGNVYVSTDGVNWGTSLFELSGSKGLKELDLSEYVNSDTEVYVKIENTSSGGLNVYGANIRLSMSTVTPSIVKDKTAVKKYYYDLWGRRVSPVNHRGFYIEETVFDDGSVERVKQMSRYK